MDFKKLNETAMSSARRVLVERFDPEAFLVYSTAMHNLQGIDIEETGVDDSIRDIFTAVSTYYKKTASGADATAEFSTVIEQVRRMLTELYYQADADGKNEIRKACEGILGM